MKTATFSTSIELLKDIIENSKTQNFSLTLQNRKMERDVLVTISAEETILNEIIHENDLYDCIGEIT